MQKAMIFLVMAIVLEVIATSALARSQSFTRLWPSVISVVGYAGAFWFLSFPLRHMPTGVVYALWSGLGIVLITMVAWIWAKQALDLAAILGLALILAGVLVIHLFSRSVSH
ncbi:QacE family quaternary ammonium compound efflux SMR transporter [Rhodobacter sp. SGA-6-6]|uniref:SMR family transporter n=1 Tax=Rhodobacter sp. SGA-6-6 TaxID=2710882 RepID=UPI0013EB7B92|nr:SMR family transporter [Rhodobacter sp. SGA-6-6]NGM47327.1 QacE family quaternary ammonium compound efflux SMR transporter [Rhodobacter sp. SGA-6-6]